MKSFRTAMAIAAIALTTLLATADRAAACGDCGCCPPPPVEVVLCVQPPCRCCAEQVTVCVPACCTGAPEVCWRRGLLGRQIATYTWCCGHEVKVVVTRRGEVRVRG